MVVLSVPRKDGRSRRKAGAVCTQGILESWPQARGAWKEKETSRTVTWCPGALGNQTILSGWRPMCFSCFFAHLLWYQNKTQSEEDGILKQYFPVISGKK